MTTIAIANSAPLAPEVNHLCPLITHSPSSELSAGLQRGRVGAGHLGLGHREAAADLAVEQRLQEALLLLRRAVVGQDLHVARCPGAEQLKAIGATTGLRPICSQRIPYSQLVRPAPNSLVGEEEVPEALLLGGGPDLDQDLGVGLPGLDLVVDRLHGLCLDRVDVFVHERLDALTEGLDLGRGLEVHG